MSSEVATHNVVMTTDTDTPMKDSQHSQHELSIEEQAEIPQNHLANDSSVRDITDTSYGNDLTQTANQLQHRECRLIITL